MVAYRRIIAFLLPFTRKAQDYVAFSITKPEQITHENTLIAFDLHDVIFQKSPTQILREILLIKGKGRIVKLAMNPYFWGYIKKLKNETNVAEDLFKRLILKYPQIKDLEAEFIRLSNAQKPKKKTVSIIKKLKEKQFKLYVLSNIAERTFEQLKIKYPAIFNNFDGALVVSPDDNYLHKPNPAYYEKFKSHLKDEGHEDKHVLFIDDLKQNIHGASNAGISGIQFSSAKNLEKTLKKLEII